MKTLLTITAIALSMMAFYIWKTVENGAFKAWYNSDESDCQLTISPEYGLLYNEHTKRYAVYHNRWICSGYLKNNPVLGILVDHDPVTTFSDSCTAKSFLKEYMRQQKEQDREWREKNEAERKRKDFK